VLSHDWLYAVRTLRRSPRFTVTVALTLALGIGANTAIFSFLNAIYLRPLPYPTAQRVVVLSEFDAKGRARGASASAYLEWRRDASQFAAVGAWAWNVVTLGGGPWPERVQVQMVAGDYFRALGVQPETGRAFTADEEAPGGGCALIVSRRLWRSWFGDDRDLAAHPIQVDGAPCAVVGRMPDGWAPPVSVSDRVDAWMPLRLDAARVADPKDRSLGVLALPAGAPPKLDPAKFRVQRLRDAVVGRPNQALFALAGAVGFLLLLACLNVATLIGARSAVQRRELAVRAALGASRGELVRHLLAQALLLATLGGAAGLAAAYWSLDALVALAHGALPRLDEARLDWRVLAFTAFLTVGSGLLFGLAPALRLSRAGLREQIARPAARRWTRHFQTVAEIAIAFVLLAGAGLLIRSFAAIRAVDLGFRTENVLSANLALPPARHGSPDRYVRFIGHVLERVRAVPGVVSATATLGVPMRGSAGGRFELPGGAPPADAEFRPADADYFTTFGMTLERGRAFDRRDVDGAPAVAVINQRLSREYFAGQDPIGKQIRAVEKSGPMPWMTIVGVARDTHHIGPLRNAMLEIYVPYGQFRSIVWQPRALVIRTAGPPERSIAALQRAVASVDPGQPLVSIGTLDRSLAEFVAPQRFDTTLLSLFAVFGLVLAATGVFGVMSYRAAQRTREIGVRMALGARANDVLGMFLRESAVATAFGVALGWAGAWMLTKALQSVLFHVEPRDLATLAATALLLGGVVMAASYAPARRAARLDPMAALRHE
jgi:putative ABC transport system permease protein